jgi:hypothetical protein
MEFYVRIPQNMTVTLVMDAVELLALCMFVYLAYVGCRQDARRTDVRQAQNDVQPNVQRTQTTETADVDKTLEPPSYASVASYV